MHCSNKNSFPTWEGGGGGVVVFAVAVVVVVIVVVFLTFLTCAPRI